MSLIEELFGNGRHPGIAPLNDEQGEKSYPLLFEMLNQREYKDGTTRCPPTILIRRVAGALEIVLRDDDFCVQKVATSKTWAGLGKALERALGDPESPWREYKSRVPTPLKKGKGKKSS
jgi:hypothetical protein